MRMEMTQAELLDSKSELLIELSALVPIRSLPVKALKLLLTLRLLRTA